MSSSMWARVARTCFIRPRVGSSPLFTRSFVLLAAKPSPNVLLRSIPLITRQQSSAALAHAPRSETVTSNLDTAPAVVEEEELPAFATLKDVVDNRIMRALTKGPFNLTTMSPVQARVLPLLPEIAEPYNSEASSAQPRDLLVRAKTGTGKTLAFLIPAVEARLKSIAAHVETAVKDSGLAPSKKLTDSVQYKFASKHTGIVVISPTRELATQIAQEAIKLTKHLEGFEVQLFVGGESKGKQVREFKRGTHDIIVATPGRLRDMLESVKDVADSVAHTQTLILDEADSLLDMGFQPDILGIQEFMPKAPERQTFLFSATVSRAIRDVARASLAKNHKFVDCVTEDDSPVHSHIPQYHTVLPSAEHQIPHILRVIAHDQLANPGKSKSIVFLPTTKMTQLFAELLREIARDTLPAGRNTSIFEIHSKKSMDGRTKASNLFRNDKSGASVLVTSDVSARGVDYPGVTRVIQVGIPSSAEQYVHRVGRTGRAGTQGRGDLILLPWERGFVSWQMSGVPLKPLTVDDHTSHTLELAKEHDADPKGFFGGEVPIANQKSSSYLRSQPLFKPSVSPVINDISRTVTEVITQVDEETVSETFMSLLGYYLGKTSELKVNKSQILEECKNWAMQAGGMPNPPTVSRGFLEKMGLNSERMDRVRKGGFKEPRKSPWVMRGHQNVREQFGRARGERGGFGESRDREFGERRFGGDKERGERRFGDNWSSRDGSGRSSEHSDRQHSDRPSFGDRQRSDRPTFGDRQRSDRPSFGDRRPGGRGGERGGQFGGERSGRFGGERNGRFGGDRSGAREGSTF